MKKGVVFFKCVVKALLKQGAGAWAKAVVGEFLLGVASDTYAMYRVEMTAAEMKAEIAELAQARQEDIQALAAEAVQQSGCNEREQAVIATYLAQIPGAIRQSQKRSADPTGRTLAADFQMVQMTDMAKILPPSLPKFAPGDALPGKRGWRLERLLGVGGFGEVWYARHSTLTSLPPGAVKFCRQGSLAHEASLINRLLHTGKHAHIVALTDADLDSAEPWLMYDYVDGATWATSSTAGRA